MAASRGRRPPPPAPMPPIIGGIRPILPMPAPVGTGDPGGLLRYRQRRCTAGGRRRSGQRATAWRQRGVQSGWLHTAPLPPPPPLLRGRRRSRQSRVVERGLQPEVRLSCRLDAAPCRDLLSGPMSCCGTLVTAPMAPPPRAPASIEGTIAAIGSICCIGSPPWATNLRAGQQRISGRIGQRVGQWIVTRRRQRSRRGRTTPARADLRFRRAGAPIVRILRWRAGPVTMMSVTGGGGGGACGSSSR